MKYIAVFSFCVFLFGLGCVKSAKVKNKLQMKSTVPHGPPGYYLKIKTSSSIIRHPGHKWKVSPPSGTHGGKRGGKKGVTGKGRFPQPPQIKTGGRKPTWTKGSDVIISGNILFNNAPGKLSSASCLLVSLEDTSRMDAPSIILSQNTIDMSGKYVGKKYKYTLKAKRPRFNFLTTTVHIVLNCGWCPKKDNSKWIRKGDYLNIVQHTIDFKDKENKYMKDVEVIQYGNAEGKDVRDDDAPSPMLGADGMRKIAYNAPRLPGKVMVSGNIVFPKAPGKLGSPSCLLVSVEDTSRMDAPSIILSRRTFDLSGQYIGKTYKFTLKAKRPRYNFLTTSFHVVLNSGWCPKESNSNWLRNGDYLNIVQHEIHFKDRKNRYTKDIEVIQYGEDDRDGEVPPEPKVPDNEEVAPIPPEVPGPAMSKCEKEAAKTNNRLLLGSYTPRCHPDGSYTRKQCHGSTGYCWCVGPKIGKEIPGTRKGPKEGEVFCGAMSKCKKQAAKANNRLMIGSYIPTCNPDGSYTKKQCHGSTGYCWCVDPQIGKKMRSTIKGPGEGEVICEGSYRGGKPT